MGWSVDNVKRSSVWEFWQAFQGYVDAHTPRQGNKLSEEEKDAIWERLQGLDAPREAVLSTQTYTLDRFRLVPAAVVRFRA